jgi:hypothetical protein
MKEKILYQEKYKKGAMRVRRELLPDTLPYMAKGGKIHAMFIQSAGTCTLDGKELEFQDVRVYTVPA